MSDRSDYAKLESILEYIENIDIIIARHNSISEALNDIEGQYALLMCIQQIGELMNIIESNELRALLPVKEAVGFRNVIVHNYGGVNLPSTEMTLEKEIPKLKETIKSILENKDIR